MYWLGYEKTAVSDDFFDLTKDSERTRFSPYGYLHRPIHENYWLIYHVNL